MGGLVVEVAGLGNFVTFDKSRGGKCAIVALFLVLFSSNENVKSWMRACAS